MHDHADILYLAGIPNDVFNTAGQDVDVVHGDQKVARVFRRNGKIVYRAGSEMDWDGTEEEDQVALADN